MMLVWFISMMAASLCLSYSCVWISSEENLLADAASHFQYDMLFQLAQYLHPKLSIPKSHLIGMKHTLTFLDESASTCGMDSHPALTKHIQQDSGPTSTLSGSILVSSSALGSSSLPLPMAYSSGLPASVIQWSSPKWLRATSAVFVPSMSMLASPLGLASHPQSKESYEVSNNFMWRKQATLNYQLCSAY